MQEEFDNLSDILKEWLGPPTTRSHVARAVSTAKPVDSIAATVAQLGTEIRVYLPLSSHSMGKWAQELQALVILLEDWLEIHSITCAVL